MNNDIDDKKGHKIRVVVLVFIAVVTVIGLVGFKYIISKNPRSSTFVIIVDPETKCEYINSSVGITPRLDRSGIQICK